MVGREGEAKVSDERGNPGTRTRGKARDSDERGHSCIKLNKVTQWLSTKSQHRSSGQSCHHEWKRGQE